MPVVSSAQLRGAGNRYPTWIARRYLPLPASVSERVLAQARALTATEPTPYDRALAIERFLRAFPYTLDLPAPPPDREIADFLLFDLRRGYCDYFATTMVVLARAAGIPARLVVGYASGSYDEGQQRYLVTEAEAHSWPELYFPDYGWIPFEPTPARAVAALPGTVPLIEPPSSAGAGPFALPQLDARWGLALLGIALVATAGGALWLLWDGWRLRHLPPPLAIALLYRRLHRLAARLGVGAGSAATPYEFSEAFQRHLAALPGAGKAIQQLTALYVGSAYAPRPLTRAQQAQALHLWQQLRPRLWRLWLRKRVSDERRPTTDDGRRTTDDRRRTTDDG